jgi:protein-arginine kinase
MSDKLEGLAVVNYSLEETKLANSFTTKVTNAYNTANAAYERANSGILATGANVTGNLVVTTGRLGLGVTPNTLLHVQGTTTIQEVIEKVNVSATALSANLNFDILNQPILYLTTNATANGTVNLRGNSTVAVDTLLRTGQSITVSLLVTNGASPYKANVVQVDGILQTAKWAGGSEPISGNPFAIDLYSYTIIKTGTAAFTVLASQQRYG